MVMFPSKSLGENTCLPLLASGGCWQSMSILGLWQHCSSLCLLCVYVQIYKSTCHWIRGYPIPSNRSNSNRSQRERRHPGGVRIWGRCLAEWRDRVATLSLAGWVHPAQSHLTLCNPTDCSLPGSSAHGILQAKILE